MSSQAALETPVKNAFNVTYAVGQTRLGMPVGLVDSHVMLTTLVSEMALLYASSLLLPLHLHNLHKQREGRTEGGLGCVYVCVCVFGGGVPELREAHVQLHLAMWRDKYGSMRGAHATVGFDDYMLRCPYDILIDSGKTPPLPFAFTKPSGI